MEVKKARLWMRLGTLRRLSDWIERSDYYYFVIVVIPRGNVLSSSQYLPSRAYRKRPTLLQTEECFHEGSSLT